MYVFSVVWILACRHKQSTKVEEKKRCLKEVELSGVVMPRFGLCLGLSSSIVFINNLFIFHLLT